MRTGEIGDFVQHAALSAFDSGDDAGLGALGNGYRRSGLERVIFLDHAYAAAKLAGPARIFPQFISFNQQRNTRFFDFIGNVAAAGLAVVKESILSIAVAGRSHAHGLHPASVISAAGLVIEVGHQEITAVSSGVSRYSL